MSSKHLLPSKYDHTILTWSKLNQSFRCLLRGANTSRSKFAEQMLLHVKDYPINKDLKFGPDWVSEILLALTFCGEVVVIGGWCAQISDHFGLLKSFDHF